MSRVLEFADEVAGLTPGLDQAQTVTNDFTTTANKNSVFFGSVTFNATNPVAVVANSELIFHDADVDFKQGFNIQGTLNWITGGGTTDKDVSGLKISGTTVIDSNRNISNVPLIQATEANIGTNALVVDSNGKVGIGTSSPASKFYVSHTTSDVSAAAASRNPIASFSGGNANNRLDVYVDNSGGTAHMGLGAYNLAGGATELGFYTGGSVTEQMRLSSTGGLGIGITTTGNYALNVSRSENQPIVAFQNPATSTSGPGCIQTSLNGSNQNNTSCHHFKATTQGVNSWYLYGNGTSSFSSDEKLKKNVETTRDGYIEDIKNLRVVKYHWKDQDETTPKELGLIAQEVEQVFPGLIQEHELEGVGEHVKHIKMSVLPLITIKAMQEQQIIIESQQSQIDALTARITALENP